MCQQSLIIQQLFLFSSIALSGWWKVATWPDWISRHLLYSLLLVSRCGHVAFFFFSVNGIWNDVTSYYTAHLGPTLLTAFELWSYEKIMLRARQPFGNREVTKPNDKKQTWWTWSSKRMSKTNPRTTFRHYILLDKQILLSFRPPLLECFILVVKNIPLLFLVTLLYLLLDFEGHPS